MRQRVRIDKNIPNEGAMDFKWLLDAPAGKHGFVLVKDGHLYFDDGIRAKFFGMNFPARAAMPTHEAAERLSSRLATMGVNVVRLHAADVITGPRGWTSNPQSPLLDYASGTSRNFHPAGMDLFDYFFYQLKKKGIYIHLDLLVARVFLEGDDLDYPEAVPAHLKCVSHFNQRMIDLQKEYAEKLLHHKNPYTKLAYKDDPAIMTVELANEDSIFFDNNRVRHFPGWKYYFEEMQQRFNHFLLMKYHNRRNLEAAWTFEDSCALGKDEVPEDGTVKLPPPGEYFQPINDPMGNWSSFKSPARYGDYVEFCLILQEKYHSEMIDFLHGIGCRVPIAPENLLRGIADVYSCIRGDLIENNAYFNHPTVGWSDKYTLVPNMAENVSNDPRVHSYPDMSHRTNIISQVSPSFVEDKPFVMTEWNEYGAYPFHSTAFPMTVAYACLQDWDGLILYCYHTSDRDDDQEGDVIADIMDSFNDPSMICQYGALSDIFLNGLIKKAQKKIQVTFTMNELKTQPSPHRLVHSILPYISQLKTSFMTDGDIYHGDGEVVISGGFLRNGDYRNAEHAVLFSQSPYRDVWRRSYAGREFYEPYKIEGTRKIAEDISLNERYLIFDNIAVLSENNDYRTFADVVSQALREWEVLKPGTGALEDGSIVSDTGEIIFQPEESRFRVQTPYISIFSGKPEEEICLGDGMTIQCKNDRITLWKLPLDRKECSNSGHFMLFAMGRSGMDETRYEVCENEKDYKMYLAGKLFMETLEGVIRVYSFKKPIFWALDMYGNRLCTLEGLQTGDGYWEFKLDGSIPSANFEALV